MNNLIPLETVNAVEIFSEAKTLHALLAEIRIQATDFVPDVTTKEGRAEIASRAYKVSRSKTVIDDARKELTAEWLAKKQSVDSLGKIARNFCDNLLTRFRWIDC